MRFPASIGFLGSLGLINLATVAVGVVFQAGMARMFGASSAMDAYVLALGLPDLIGSVFFLGTFATVLAPVFARTRHRAGDEEAWRLVSQLITVLTILGLALSAAVYVLAPALLAVLAPGFAGETFETAVRLTRWLFPTVVLSMLRSSLLSLLNIGGRFAVPYLLVLVVKCIVLATFFGLAPRHGIDLLVALVWLDGVLTTLGLWWLLPERRSLRLRLGWTPAFRGALASAALVTVVAILGQASDYAYRWFGSFLPEGAISLYYYASKFMPISLGLFSVMVGRTLLPRLSELFARGDRRSVGSEVGRAFRTGVFLLVPLLSGLWVGRDAVLSLLLYGGRFGRRDLEVASELVLLLLPATAACALTSVFQVVLYAEGRMKRAALVTGSALALDVVLMAWLVPRYGVRGLAMTMAISRIAIFFVTWQLAELRARSFSPLTSVPWAARLTLAGLAFVVATKGLAAVLDVVPWAAPLRFLAIEAAAFAAIYPVALHLCGIKAVRDAWSDVRRPRRVVV